MLRHTTLLALLGLGLSACLLLAFPLGSYGRAAADTWSGTWSRAEDGVSGTLTLVQSGSAVSGSYTWNTGGTVAGSVSGATFTGSFSETHYEGTFVLTLSATKFTGSYSGKNRDTGGDISGPFDGTCAAGDCLQNGAAPPPPPPPPSTSAVKISGLSRKVEVQLEDGAWQTATDSIELRPGTKIHTGFKAGATLTFPDGSTLDVKPMSLVLIRATGPNGQLVGLQLGEVKAEIQKLPSSRGDFNVRTPTTTASSRGTAFSVLYDGSATIVSVTTDSVLVTPNRGAAVTVPAGKEAASSATAVSPPTAIGKAGAPPGSVGPAKAVTLVTASIAGGLTRCKAQAYSVSLKPLKNGWRATVKVIGTHAGTAIWTIVGTKVSPTNALARKIAAGCS